MTVSEDKMIMVHSIISPLPKILRSEYAEAVNMSPNMEK